MYVGYGQIYHKALWVLLDIISPTMFDHLIKIKEWFLIPYIDINKSTYEIDRKSEQYNNSYGCYIFFFFMG